MAAVAHLLVVEDDPDVRGLVADILNGEGYAVSCAASLRQALAAMEGATFDLVLSDALVAARPGGADWWGALDCLAAHAKSVPLIICTAQAAGAYTDFRAHGFAAFISKPFDLDALIETVSATLASARVRR